MDAAPHCPEAGFGADPAVDARLRRDEQLVSIAVAAAVAFTLLGFAAGYLAAPSPLDIPAPCAAHHAAER